MAWPRSFIDEVRQSSDAVRVIGEVVALKKRVNRWVGLCPFHTEKTPSFGVNDEGLWYCFGCGEGGDIFKFVQRHEGGDFADSVRSLAARAGIRVPESRSRGSQRDTEVRRDRIMAVLAAAQELYAGGLGGAERASSYLAGRGLSPEVIARFGLGYAPAGWDTIHKALGRTGFSVPEMEAAGLVKRRADGSGSYDLLRDRIVFPIRDLRGRTVAFGGRVLEEGEPKYLNSPETRVFVKSRMLYGLGEAREAIRAMGFVLLVEGNIDLLACVEHGFTNVVAPLGTAFSAEHARLLAKQATKAVVAFDGDDAGHAGAERTVGTFLAAGLQVSVARLPAGQDPDSLLQEAGAEGLKQQLRNALPALSFLVERVSERNDLRSPRGKAEAVASLLAFVLQVDDRVERAEWIGKIAEALHVDEHLVARSFAELRQRGRQRRDIRAEPRDERPVLGGFEQVPLAERDLLRAVLARPQWLPKLRETYGEGAIRDARVAGLLEALQGAEADEPGRPVPAELLLEGCDVPGADALLSRLLVEGGSDIEWDYARGCALGIRRDALRGELRRVQSQIEEALGAGQDDVTELEQRKLALARELRSG